jgi:hypothetical protein
MTTNPTFQQATPHKSPHGFDGVIVDHTYFLLDEHTDRLLSKDAKEDYYSTVIRDHFVSNPAKNNFGDQNTLIQCRSPQNGPQNTALPRASSTLSIQTVPNQLNQSNSSTNGSAPPLPPRKPGGTNRPGPIRPGATPSNASNVPILDATIPFQAYPPTPVLDQGNPLREIDYRYSERYFYEEGVAAKKYWLGKYYNNVLPERYNRDDVQLPLKQTNMFHFNGDIISQQNIQQPSKVCMGFDIETTSGHRLLDDNETVSMVYASNWGNDVYTSFALGHAIRYENSRQPIHYTIHGGNASITGAEDEVHSSFLGGKQNCCYHSIIQKREQNSTTKSKLLHVFKKEKKIAMEKPPQVLQQDPMGRICQSFPSGKWGRFAISGTHDMLSHGNGYVHCLLQSMGIVVSPDHVEPLFPQLVSFFTLENKYWRVVALDSGYYAKLGHQHEDRLPQDLLRWLDSIVRLEDDTRGLVFISHHNSSSRQNRYKFLVKAIHDIIGHQRKIIWISGDEHSTAIYQENSKQSQVLRDGIDEYPEGFSRDAINTYSFVCGNGGLPLEPFQNKGISGILDKTALSINHKDLIMYDARVAYQRNYGAIDKDIAFMVGHPGFMRIDFTGTSMTITIKSLQLQPPASIASFGHEFNVETPMELAKYTFDINIATGDLVKTNSTVYNHPMIITSVVPPDYRFISTPTEEQLLPLQKSISSPSFSNHKKDDSGPKLPNDRVLHSQQDIDFDIRAGLRNLFLDSLDDWTQPAHDIFPITVSNLFYEYAQHLGQAIGDPNQRDMAREAAKMELQPKHESYLSQMRSSMKSSMKNLLDGFDHANNSGQVNDQSVVVIQNDQTPKIRRSSIEPGEGDSFHRTNSTLGDDRSSMQLNPTSLQPQQSYNSASGHGITVVGSSATPAPIKTTGGPRRASISAGMMMQHPHPAYVQPPPRVQPTVHAQATHPAYTQPPPRVQPTAQSPPQAPQAPPAPQAPQAPPAQPPMQALPIPKQPSNINPPPSQPQQQGQLLPIPKPPTFAKTNSTGP